MLSSSLSADSWDEIVMKSRILVGAEMNGSWPFLVSLLFCLMKLYTYRKSLQISTLQYCHTPPLWGMTTVQEDACQLIACYRIMEQYTIDCSVTILIFTHGHNSNTEEIAYGNRVYNTASAVRLHVRSLLTCHWYYMFFTWYDGQFYTGGSVNCGNWPAVRV